MRRGRSEAAIKIDRFLAVLSVSRPLGSSADSERAKPEPTCNQDGTLCVKADVEQSVVVNPLYFEVRVRCSEQIKYAQKPFHE